MPLMQRGESPTRSPADPVQVARPYVPPVARAFVVVSGDDDEQATFIGQHVAMRHASRVLAEI